MNIKYRTGLYGLCFAIGTFSLYAGEIDNSRMLWGSVADITHGWLTNVPALTNDYGKVLLSWRMLPQDTPGTAFDLYMVKDGHELKINSEPIAGRNCYQIPEGFLSETKDYEFHLKMSGSTKIIGNYTLTQHQLNARLPYISIYMKETSDSDLINDVDEYLINDGTIGDVDGDGEYEILLARCAYGYNSDTVPKSPVIIEAYKLDGTFMWRIVCGNNIPSNNSIAIIVADFDGDGKDEVATRTSEGTVFGDGTEIGDVNNDGKTEYAEAGKHNSLAPEFISIIDGTSGTELARAPYIPIGTSQEWGDDYFKRANSLRLAACKLKEGEAFQIVATRGIYAKMVLEAWEYDSSAGALKKIWRFSTDDYPEYIGQGNHQLAVADVDNDGYDEITYGASCIDHNGTGLYSTGLGHGDMLHVGKFIQERDGLQCFQCFETGRTRCSLRDARTGDIIWKLEAETETDEGRCMIADIDPDNPGYEAWVYDKTIYTDKGIATEYHAPQVNFPIWWSGSLNRQLFDRGVIDRFSRKSDKNRVFNLNRYDVACANGSKSNACFIGDILGDWREEIVIARKHPQAMENNRPLPGSQELMIFSTWYPTEYQFPYLMSDNVYYRCAKHQHVGYNTPSHLGFYLGSDGQYSGIITVVPDQTEHHIVMKYGQLCLPEMATDIDMYSIDGKLIYTTDRMVNGKIPVPNGLDGLYIIRYVVDGRNYVSKVLILQ